MARPGYIEARNRLWSAQDRLRQMETNWEAEMARVPLPPDHFYRREREAAIAQVRAEVEEARSEFAAFDRGKVVRTKRVYYDEHLVIHLGVSRELGDAIKRQLDGGRTLADITREALTEYLLTTAE